MRNILPVQNTYADTLLALGVHHAYGIDVEIGTNVAFHGEPTSPRQFPVAVDTPPWENIGRDEYSEQIDYTLSALKAIKQTRAIADQWNELLPTYDEVMALIYDEMYAAQSLSTTRFWDVPKRWCQAAAFHPQGAKSEDADGAKYVPEFWVKEALRGIGFVKYARVFYLREEHALNRYVIAVPRHPVNLHNEVGIMRTANGCMVQLHAAASELQTQIAVVRYAELNVFARTFFGEWLLMPHDLSGVEAQLRQMLYGLRYFPLNDEANLCQKLLSVIEQGDISALSDVVMRYNWFVANHPKLKMYVITPDLVEVLALC